MQMSKKRKSIKGEIRALDMMVCGEAFQRVAEELIPSIPLTKAGSFKAINNEAGNIIVCASNLAFAIELYLKALLLHLDLEVPRTHDLSELYEKVPKQVRQLMESVYKEALPGQVRQLGGHVSITFAKGPRREPLWDDDNRTLVLSDLLMRSKNLFESWRYVFEYCQPNDNFYQYHQFEYGFLWCAAETIKAEIKVRLAMV